VAIDPMNERQLVNFALFCVIIGFMGLFLLLLLQKPVFREVASDVTIALPAIITDVSSTTSGSVLTFTRTGKAYIDAVIPQTLIGQSVTLVGQQEGDFFYVASIEVLAPDVHS
jgi:hypothetical protein